MKTKTQPYNFRVVVEPNTRWCDPSNIRSLCEEIQASIKRHVDEVRHTGIEYSQDDICEYCKTLWTEDSDTYNGGCCDKDEENNPESVSAAVV